jgi:hypothetical protein
VGNTVNIQAIINSVPPNMRDRYLGTDDMEPEIVAIADGADTVQESADKE